MRNFLFFCLMITLFAACTCEEHEVLITEDDVPNPFFVETVIYNEVDVEVYFNKPVDPTSVKLGESLIIEVENSSYIGVPDVDDQVVYLYGCDFFCADPSCLVTVTLKGDDGGIRSLDDQLLDGDRNGTDGGDHTAELKVDHCITVIEPPFVVSPEHGGSSTEYICYIDDEFKTSIIFSEPIDPSSVILDTTLSISYDLIDGDIGLEEMNWISSTELELVFQLDDCQTCGVTINFWEAGGFLSVSSLSSGLALDGDRDGTPGGTYEVGILIEATTQVESPNANQTNSTDFIEMSLPFGGTLMRINIGFSNEMDTTTLNKQTLTLTHLSTLVNVPLNFFWNNQTNLSVTSESNIYSFCGESCFFTLKLNDDNPDQVFIFDQNGIELDGDEDCQPGGLYETTFQLF